MKRRIEIIIMICLVISTVVFGVLWQKAENNNEDIKWLAQTSAYQSYTQFLEYQEHGRESAYWYGVADFRAFQNAYSLLTQDTNKSTNRTYCNDFYGYLVLSPDECQTHISEVVKVMNILAKDVEDENGYIRMFELRNLLKYG